MYRVEDGGGDPPGEDSSTTEYGQLLLAVGEDRQSMDHRILRRVWSIIAM